MKASRTGISDKAAELLLERSIRRDQSCSHRIVRVHHLIHILSIHRKQMGVHTR
jgi:hypothetical protein